MRVQISMSTITEKEPIPRRLLPNLYARLYTTKDGRKRTVYICRFVDWKGVRWQFPLGDSLDVAKQVRDQLLRQNLLGHDFYQPRRRAES